MSIQPGAVLNTQGFGNRPEGVEVPVVQTRPPTTADTHYPIGKAWIDTHGNGSYTLTSISTVGGVTTANWVTASNVGGIQTINGNTGSVTGNIVSLIGNGPLAFSGSGTVMTGTITPGTSLGATITGNTGGALPPTAGNWNIVGAGNLTTSGAGSTLTISQVSQPVLTLTGSTSGGAIPPNGAGNITLTAGTGITIAGAGNALTFTSTGADPILLQQIRNSVTTAASTNTVIGAIGASVPTGGTLLHSISITPISNTSVIEFDAIIQSCILSPVGGIFYVTVGAGAAVSTCYQSLSSGTANLMSTVNLNYSFSPGSTAAITFNVYWGCDGSGFTYVNCYGATNINAGGTFLSFYTATEYSS